MNKIRPLCDYCKQTINYGEKHLHWGCKKKYMENQLKYFTGVGSRECPDEIKGIIKVIAAVLAKKGYILRSGAATGSDESFENGYNLVGGNKEIYLPWQNFNDNKSELYNVSDEALKMAAEIHPAWDKLSQGAQKLHGRNTTQILGKDLNTPSKFVICYTENGETKGGTATAIKLAQKYNIPVYNIGKEEDLVKVLKKL